MTIAIQLFNFKQQKANYIHRLAFCFKEEPNLLKLLFF
jgi:hypothetical protein